MQHQPAFFTSFQSFSQDTDAIAHGVVGLGVGFDMPTLFGQAVEKSGDKLGLGVARRCTTRYMVASFWWIG
jgi:hypothetical protein